MAKTEKQKAKLDQEEKEENEPKSSKSIILLNSSDDDDDEEANEDLTLKIVEKSLLKRKAKLAQNDENDAVFVMGDIVDVVDLSSSDSPQKPEEVEVVVVSKRKIKRKKNKVTIATEEEEMKTETAAANAEVVKDDLNLVEISDNIVLRKLLRGARYFDPPDSGGWETCYNCGEEGHMAVNCTSAVKRKKPCFVCGSLDHAARQCTKGQDCYICKKGGHRAKDCPEKYKSGFQNAKICLKCGCSGHDMFSCKNDYSHDDLKEIQCYVCKSFGHLCCVNSVDTSPRGVSCYKCGEAGHTGLACGRLRGETTGVASPSSCYKCGEEGHFARECTSSAKVGRLRGETTGMASPSSCYKCGEEGHFARECTSSAKFGKRNRDFSTPTLRPHRENKDRSGFKSAPHDLGKAHRRKNTQYEGHITTPRKSKGRGGWITEDPGDFSERKSKRNRWRSPATPSKERHKISASTAGGHSSSSKSSKNRTSNHRFSASRFGNFGSEEKRRNYNW